MPKIVKPITQVQLNNLKPTTATQVSDGRGLYLKLYWARPSGHSWRFDFTSPATGKGSTMVIGDLKHTTIAEARRAADGFRKMLNEGKCPMQARRGAEVAAEVAAVHAERKDKGLPALGTFKAVALDFAARKFEEGAKKNDWSADHAEKWERILKLHAFPKLGAKHVKDLKPVDFLNVVQVLEKADKMETALCVRRFCSQVMDHAALLELCEYNPVGVIKRHVKTGTIRKSFAAVKTPEALGDLIKKIAAYENPLVRGVLLMMAYTAQRPANVRGMRWAHLDLANALWVIPAAEMKNSQERKRKGPPHVVPLPKQAVALLRTLRKDAEEDDVFVFPNNFRALRKISCMGKGAPVRALARMGITGDDMTAHGFRATMRTMGEVQLGLNPLMLEQHLAHAVGIKGADGTIKADSLKNAYFRPEYERAGMVQQWADYLGKLAGGNPGGLKIAA